MGAETTEAPTREMDAATVVAALDRLAPVAQRRVAKQALGRLLAPEERDPYADPPYVTLAAARKVLDALAAEHYALAYGGGKGAGGHGIGYQACHAAEESVFDALNVLTHHCNDQRAREAIDA